MLDYPVYLIRSRNFIIICFLFALFIFGCSGIKVSQDYQPDTNFNNLKTYTWKYITQEKTGDVRIDNSLMDNRIRKATEIALLEKGLIAAEKTPDFQVAYTYTISKKIYSRPVNTGVGFGYGSYRRYRTIGIRTGTQVDEYDEGLLVIDFLKPDSDIVLWRGKSTHGFDTHSTPESTTEQINKIVEKILSQFPPGEPL